MILDRTPDDEASVAGHARDRACEIARRDPPPGVRPDDAVAEVRDVLDSIGDTCPECTPTAPGGATAGSHSEEWRLAALGRDALDRACDYQRGGEMSGGGGVISTLEPRPSCIGLRS